MKADGETGEKFLLAKISMHNMVELFLRPDSPMRLNFPSINYLTPQEMEVSDNPSLRRDTSDPMLICTAYKKNRFYLFTRKDPDDIKG